MPLIDFKKYPFLKPLEEELKKYAGGITLNDLLVSGTYYLNKAKERIKKILSDEELEPYEKIKDSILVFYTTLYLIAALDSDFLKKKFVEKEVELIEKNLLNETEETILEISKILQVNVSHENLLIKYKENRKLLTIPFKFSMNFIDYLKNTKEARKENDAFSLTSRILKDGKIFLTKEEISKILSYKVKDMLYESINISKVNIPEEIKKFAEELKGRKTPPCIINLLNKNELNEIELSVIVTYFINIGDYKNAEIFSKDKDLAKKLRGDKRIKYIVYSCDKMRKLGLCVASCNVLNPLQLYYGKLE